MLDSRSGRLISTSEFLVQMNHQQEPHADWVVKNQDGAGEMTAPPGATVISVHAKYEDGMSLFVNCDVEKDKGSPDRAAGLDRWYSVSEILTSGVVAPNGCGKPKDQDRVKAVAKPGEFVFFVRKKNWREAAVD